MNGIDVYESAGEGYRRLVNGAKWTLATLNYAPRFDEANIVDLERHNLTDETFVLLQGTATLLTFGGEGAAVSRIPLEPLKYYNVRAGIWHNIVVSRDARVLVAENADTSKDNTDYLDIRSGRILQKRPAFERVLPDTFVLKVPFGPVWTGIILVRGERNVLIDSSHLPPEKYLLPALADLGLKLSDIDWLLNTHVHGDHIGGHHALATAYGLKTATLRRNADALRDPVSVAIRVRTRFPKNSPAPQSFLKGVEPDLLLDEGELLAGRFACFSTPGHDDDCQTWVDTKTGTAFTGDSLQANGTPCQGLAFYRSLAAYRATLKKLGELPLANIVCGHVYDGIGDVILGAENVRRALDYSEGRLKLYGERLKVYVKGSGTIRHGGAPAAVSADETFLAPLARRLIGEVGCGMPEMLFMALHTVSEHLKEMTHD